MVAVVIPCYKVRSKILDVIASIGAETKRIYAVDDACPEGSGKFIEANCTDPRVEVLYNPTNLGVGGAVMTGYRKALSDGATIVVKIDGDGQMDPTLIPRLIDPIISHAADYVKGNRFYDLVNLKGMPAIRKLGNSLLSFVSKAVNGYWHLMDPANGFTAIHRSALSMLPLEKIDNRFFFENDMLFRLNTIRAVVQDMPMKAVYADEKSNLRIGSILLRFPLKYLNRFIKRIFYNYFLRDFNIGSLELVMSLALFLFGFTFGFLKWSHSIVSGHPATAGTVILAGLPVILGFQALLAFLHFDLINVPEKPLSKGMYPI